MRDCEFKDWRQKHPNEEQTAVCKYCQQNIKFTQKCDLTAHAHSQKHKDNIEGTFETMELQGPSFDERVANF